MASLVSLHPGLQQLLTQEVVASLAVIHQGYPLVTLVPFVIQPDPLRLYVLISDLAAHTQALREARQCSLLIHEPTRPEDPQSNHALRRVTFQAEAQHLSRSEAADLGVEATYRANYPIADVLLGLADFHFYRLTPTSGTLIEGFGKISHLSMSELDPTAPAEATVQS